ncbi:unnamed protein product [Rotaria socialis]|uniref:B box-type domain-containing protein n=1 Tax=Rotaria socialis TaxID=392032 RepID=A0A820QX96_9BILA|nr:unnamed protein product [Rotaria socialis]CAF4431413.1 unnamed protein product [Rotaria socialis]
MTTDKKNRKYCAKCVDNQGVSGLFICDGCQNMFCIRHVNEHQAELSNQLEIVIYEHDSIQQQLSQSSSDHVLLQKINNWEIKSIEKIQIAAERARNDLQQLIEKTNQRLSKICTDIAVNLRSASKTKDFSETDLEEWRTQLSELKNNIDSAISCNLIKDKRSPIYTIKIEADSAANQILKKQLSYKVDDRFCLICGPVQLDCNAMRSTYVGDDEGYGRIRGQQKYSQSRNTIRFKIEKTRSPQALFFGITTSNADLDQRLWSDPATIGWCGDNSIWVHGYHDDIKSQSVDDRFQFGDILQLILNCDRNQIELYNERTDKTHIQCVDLKETPFPWHFLVGLCSYGDCVNIV